MVSAIHGRSAGLSPGSWNGAGPAVIAWRGTAVRIPVCADPPGSAGSAHAFGDDPAAGVPELAEDDVVEDRIVGRIE